MVGVAYHAVIEVDDGALPAKFTATTLPAGLALNPVTGVISGVPTQAGTRNVTLGATNAKGAAAPQTYTFTVAPLPKWAQGTFDGVAFLKYIFVDTKARPGVASMSVTAQGKITGKFLCGGTNFAFSAASYLPTEKGFDELGFEAVAKAGKVVMPLSFRVQLVPPPYDGSALQFLGMANGAHDGVVGTCEVHLYRNTWRDAGMAAVATNFTGYYTATLAGGADYGSGYLTFTVDRVGGVKVAGKLADGTAVSQSGPLLTDESMGAQAVLYSSPVAYQGGCVFGVVEFDRTGDSSVPFLRMLEGKWDSRSPQATRFYGTGFARTLALSGGWYNALINLRTFYEHGLSVGGVTLPVLNALVKNTEWRDETHTGKMTETVELPMSAVEDATPNGLVLGVTPATPATSVGTGLAAPRADTPRREGLSASYDYTVDTTGDGVANMSGLTFTYLRATGLFSGSFKAWYDYASVLDATTGVETWTHTSKTFSFAGVLTPVREEGDTEGRGFFLSAEKGWFDSGRDDPNGLPIMTPFTYNGSYDFLLSLP
jgi:hypothetical protein